MRIYICVLFLKNLLLNYIYFILLKVNFYQNTITSNYTKKRICNLFIKIGIITQKIKKSRSNIFEKT